MGDRSQGLIDKFRVERTDGRSAAGEKHHGCRYFVLDLDHDRFAWPALAAYAKACEKEYPLLAADLNRLAGERQRECSWCRTPFTPPNATEPRGYEWRLKFCGTDCRDKNTSMVED